MINKLLIDERFLVELFDRLRNLENQGYPLEKIAKILEHPSKICEFENILRESNLILEKKTNLQKKFEDIAKSFENEAPRYSKYIKEEMLNEDTIGIENILDDYLKIVYQGHIGLGKQICKIRNCEIVEYFGLLPGRIDSLASLFPYRKILIVRKGKRFNVFKTEKHLSKNYEKIKNIFEFQNELECSFKKIKKTALEKGKTSLLKTYTLFMCATISQLARELGIMDRLSDKILEKIEVD